MGGDWSYMKLRRGVDAGRDVVVDGGSRRAVGVENCEVGP